MKKLIASICAVAVTGAAMGASSPAVAASPAGGAQFVQVAQYQNYDHRRFEMRGQYAYYNGHRGDRHRHPGWRQYNGYWFPPAAFLGAVIGGAIIGGAIAHSR